MAETVAAFGVPHTPNFPALVAKAGPDCETAKLYAEIAKRLRELDSGAVTPVPWSEARRMILGR